MCQPIHIDDRFGLPSGGEPGEGSKVNIPVVVKEVREHPDGVIGVGKRVPGSRVASQETRLPEGEENVAEGSFRPKTLG